MLSYSRRTFEGEGPCAYCMQEPAHMFNMYGCSCYDHQGVPMRTGWPVGWYLAMFKEQSIKLEDLNGMQLIVYTSPDVIWRADDEHLHPRTVFYVKNYDAAVVSMTNDPDSDMTFVTFHNPVFEEVEEPHWVGVHRQILRADDEDDRAKGSAS